MLKNNYTKQWIDCFLGHLEKLTLQSLQVLLESTDDNGYHLALVKKAIGDGVRESIIAQYILSYANTPALLSDVLDGDTIEIKPEYLELISNFEESCCLAFLEMFPNCKFSCALFCKLQSQFGESLLRKL